MKVRKYKDKYVIRYEGYCYSLEKNNLFPTILLIFYGYCETFGFYLSRWLRFDTQYDKYSYICSILYEFDKYEDAGERAADYQIAEDIVRAFDLLTKEFLRDKKNELL